MYVYVGPFSTGVTVQHPDPEHPDATASTVCAPDVPVDLPDDIAESLVAAGVLAPAKGKGKATTTTTQNEEG